MPSLLGETDEVGLRLGVGDLEHRSGIQNGNTDVPVFLTQDDVAGKQQADRPVRVECLVGELWVTRAQDDVGLHLGAKLLFQRLLDVDFREDTEPLRLQCVDHSGLDLRESAFDAGRHLVTCRHLFLRFGPSTASLTLSRPGENLMPPTKWAHDASVSLLRSDRDLRRALSQCFIPQVWYRVGPDSYLKAGAGKNFAGEKDMFARVAIEIEF